MSSVFTINTELFTTITDLIFYLHVFDAGNVCTLVSDRMVTTAYKSSITRHFKTTITLCSFFILLFVMRVILRITERRIVNMPNPGQ
jgi:hypothetical protein